MIICRCKILFKKRKPIRNDFEVKDSTHMIEYISNLIKECRNSDDDIVDIHLQFINEYDEFIRLLKNGKDKQFIRTRLRLSDRKYHELLNYYQHNKEQLTMIKYQKLIARGMTKEQIGEYFKIPKSELDYFLDKHNE